jgi:hypothetical protein
LRADNTIEDLMYCPHGDGIVIRCEEFFEFVKGSSHDRSEPLGGEDFRGLALGTKVLALGTKVVCASVSALGALVDPRQATSCQLMS